jgi:hypothetical protein
VLQLFKYSNILYKQPVGNANRLFLFVVKTTGCASVTRIHKTQQLLYKAVG